MVGNKRQNHEKCWIHRASIRKDVFTRRKHLFKFYTFKKAFLRDKALLCHLEYAMGSSNNDESFEFYHVSSIAFLVAMTLYVVFIVIICYYHYYYCVASGMVITATRMRSLVEDSLLGIWRLLFICTLDVSFFNNCKIYWLLFCDRRADLAFVLALFFMLCSSCALENYCHETISVFYLQQFLSCCQGWHRFSEN